MSACRTRLAQQERLAGQVGQRDPALPASGWSGGAMMTCGWSPITARSTSKCSRRAARDREVQVEPSSAATIASRLPTMTRRSMRGCPREGGDQREGRKYLRGAEDSNRHRRPACREWSSPRRVHQSASRSGHRAAVLTPPGRCSVGRRAPPARCGRKRARGLLELDRSWSGRRRAAVTWRCVGGRRIVPLCGDGGSVRECFSVTRRTSVFKIFYAANIFHIIRFAHNPQIGSGDEGRRPTGCPGRRSWSQSWRRHCAANSRLGRDRARAGRVAATAGESSRPRSGSRRDRSGRSAHAGRAPNVDGDVQKALDVPGRRNVRRRASRRPGRTPSPPRRPGARCSTRDDAARRGDRPARRLVEHRHQRLDRHDLLRPSACRGRPRAPLSAARDRAARRRLRRLRPADRAGADTRQGTQIFIAGPRSGAFVLTHGRWRSRERANTRSTPPTTATGTRPIRALRR